MFFRACEVQGGKEVGEDEKRRNALPAASGLGLLFCLKSRQRRTSEQKKRVAGEGEKNFGEERNTSFRN